MNALMVQIITVVCLDAVILFGDFSSDLCDFEVVRGFLFGLAFITIGDSVETATILLFENDSNERIRLSLELFLELGNYQAFHKCLTGGADMIRNAIELIVFAFHDFLILLGHFISESGLVEQLLYEPNDLLNYKLCHIVPPYNNCFLFIFDWRMMIKVV